MPNKLSLCFAILIILSHLILHAEQYFASPTPIKELTGVELQELLSRESRGESSPELYYSIARRYNSRGDFQKAKEYLLKAIGLSPDNSFLYGELGRLELEHGQQDSALAHLERALELDYEYLAVWQTIVKLAPKYYFNLGMLYKEKALEFSSVELARKGIEYLDKYMDNMPRGKMVKEASSAKSELKLFITELRSKERRAEYERKIREEEEKRKTALGISIRNFRENRPHLIKLNLNTFKPFQSFVFRAKDPSTVEQDTVVIKPNISEFTLTALLIEGPIFVGAFIGYGSATVDRQFTRSYNYLYPPGDPRYEVKGSIASISSIRAGGELLYNFYFRPPLLFIIGLSGDYAVFLPKEKENTFKSISGHELCWQLGIYFSFGDFLGELGYNFGLVGNRRGGTIRVGIGYKI